MKKFFFGFIICLVVICALAWTPTDRMFNRNQFGTNNFSINIASGVLVTNATFRQEGTTGNAINLPFNSAGETIMQIGNFYLRAEGDSLDFLESVGVTSLLRLQDDNVIIQEHLDVQEQLNVAMGQGPLAISSTGFGSSNYFQGDTRFDSNIWSWASTTEDFTNSSVTAAFPYGDANGKQGEATSANFISTVGGTPDGSKFLRDDWTWVATGAGTGDTNGISYVDGSLLIDAVRTRRDAGDNHVLDLVWTNNVSALVFTNQDTASSIYFRYMNGHIPLFMTEGAGIFINSELDLQLSADSVLALQANTDVRTLNNTNGTTVIDFSGDEVVIDTVNVQQFNINNISVTNDLAVTNNLHVIGDARFDSLAGSGTRMVVADADGDVSTQAIPSGGGASTWSTSWAGTRDGTQVGYNMAGTQTASGEGLILRVPAPISGWATNLVGMFSNGNNPVAAGTNTGWTLFTNGVATSFHFEQAGNGSLVLCDSGTVTTYIVKDSMMALRGTNNSSGYSMQLNASIQIVPADAP